MHQAWPKSVVLQATLWSQPDVRDGDFEVGSESRQSVRLRSDRTFAGSASARASRR